MGWNKGLGADLTRQIQDMVEPTYVFEVEAPAFESGWPPAALLPRNDTFVQPNNMKLNVLEPIAAPILANNYSPADHRNLSILSYFHAIFPSFQPKTELQQISASSWDTALPLCARPPYEVDWTQALDKVFLTGSGMEDVVPPEIERVLNGAIVGLVSCEADAIDVDPNPSNQTIPFTQGASAISPSISTCRGLALVRSVSSNSAHLHVLTPLPSYLLAKCRVLVKGELELPVWGMLDFRSDGGLGET
jgi:polynucleotide 5'-hydroxyl-kinase GRC3/NOL9